MEPTLDTIPLRGRSLRHRSPRRPALARLHSALLARLWLLTTWAAAKRRVRAGSGDVERHVYRQQTRGMGLRMTEWLRDRLRPRWLRLRSAGQDQEQE